MDDVLSMRTLIFKFLVMSNLGAFTRSARFLNDFLWESFVPNLSRSSVRALSEARLCARRASTDARSALLVSVSAQGQQSRAARDALSGRLLNLIT